MPLRVRDDPSPAQQRQFVWLLNYWKRVNNGQRSSGEGTIHLSVISYRERVTMKKGLMWRTRLGQKLL